MIWTRRRAMGWGGGIVAALSMAGRTGLGGDWVEIQMSGRDGGAEVWFDPIGILIEPGRTVRWINRDGGNAHTATAYHPDLFDRPLRIPEHASPWDSDYLLPGDAFSLTLTEPGVYDYYCVPHEMAGMVGRIIVGEPGPGDRRAASGAAQGIPDAALAAFPKVEAIMAMGIVRRA